ncbi:MAG TPA: hypothetical protein VJ898_00820 [Natrialbaceae archaeon]|nr:hypothetical protein [Natrialbaceae archaeon]
MSTVDGWGLRGMAQQANPAFAAGAVVVPVAALAGAIMTGDFRPLFYVHVMAGVLWTGVDVFMGAVLGPVLGGLSIDERASVFERFTPKMTFLMPTLAVVTIGGGITLATELGKFPHANPWLAIVTAAVLLPVVPLIAAQFDALRDRRTVVAFVLALAISAAALAVTLPAFAWTSQEMLLVLGIVTLLSVLGFGVILPGEVRIYRELRSTNPDTETISTIGMRNARLGGVQGLLQLGIIVAMTFLRF